MGIFKEIFTGEMVKKLRGKLEGSFLDKIPDMSGLVDNNVIHLVEVGVDPDVLVNNDTYPIPTQALNDSDLAITLDKFQTKVTPITDDELHAISYDKMQRVIESHGNAIGDSEKAKAAHALCPQKNTATTPVLGTTGEVAEGGRKRMTLNDLLAMKKAMDTLNVPEDGRRLVLCNDHVQDLLALSEAFVRQYNIDTVNGKIGRLFGFDIYEYGSTPLFTVAGEKKAVNATAGTGEFKCSFAFYTGRVFKATGSLDMYYREAKTDPEKQQNTINFRQYFIAMPKKMDNNVVMTSSYEAPQSDEEPELG